ENREKPSQLNYKLPALAVEIRLDGIKNVKELFKAIREQCSVEIYPDFRLASYDLKVQGEAAPAADILRAAALCVGGTYRQVGPAYVLA
ncbi:hypothetical protein, partial [Salmonella enterica]|uniref:hypothetical protein n=1 Tax=Salmonella enterica TaxID=28901 RepID=UPI003CEFC1C5